MKTIEVVAAILRKGERVFATQRGYGDWKDLWEFPGGKIEPGEGPEEALVREIREELGAQIAVESYLTTIDYDYPAFHLHMGCYLCRVTGGELTLKEHEAARWLSRDDPSPATMSRGCNGFHVTSSFVFDVLKRRLFPRDQILILLNILPVFVISY